MHANVAVIIVQSGQCDRFRHYSLDIVKPIIDEVFPIFDEDTFDVAVILDDILVAHFLPVHFSTCFGVGHLEILFVEVVKVGFRDVKELLLKDIAINIWVCHILFTIQNKICLWEEINKLESLSAASLVVRAGPARE